MILAVYWIVRPLIVWVRLLSYTNMICRLSPLPISQSLKDTPSVFIIHGNSSLSHGVLPELSFIVVRPRTTQFWVLPKSDMMVILRQKFVPLSIPNASHTLYNLGRQMPEFLFLQCTKNWFDFLRFNTTSPSKIVLSLPMVYLWKEYPAIYPSRIPFPLPMKA